MNRLKYIIFLISVFFSVSVVSCDQYNTEVVGEKFAPYNSLVTMFRQLVYVEYKDGKAKVWGPYAKEVDVKVEDSNVYIQSDLDSLVVFAYGNAVKERDNVYHGSLSINSDGPYALYLSGLNLMSVEGPAIQSLGSKECFLVLTDKSQNRLNGQFITNGPLIIDGGGSLQIEETDETALLAKGGLTCSYPVKVRLLSENGDGLHVDNSDVKIADGEWTIKAGKNAISNTSGQVIINGGKVYGHALDGSFVTTSSTKGLVTNESTCIAVAGKESSLFAEERQFIWQAKVDTLALSADSVLVINRIPSSDDVKTIEIAKFKPAYNYETPWLLISVPSLIETDWVTFKN